MSIMLSLQGIGSFALYFLAAIVAEAVFLVVYMGVTRHNEIRLIKEGNVAASVSLAGAVVGFTLPLASVVIHSVSLLDMAVWSVVALVVQVVLFLLADRLLRGLSQKIEENNVAAGITLAASALAIGIINAASMSY